MHTNAVILRTTPFKEHDLLVHCYTEQGGSCTAVARGALRAGSVQRMHVGAGTLVRFSLVSAKGFPVITGAQTLCTFGATQGDVRRRCASWVILEAIHALVRGQERDDALWSTVTEALAVIDRCDEAHLLTVLRTHERALLTVMGYAPRADECGACGGTVGIQGLFSITTGSVLCSECGRRGWHGVALQQEDIAWLAGSTDRAPSAGAPVRAPTECLLEHLIGAPLRSLELLFRAVRA